MQERKNFKLEKYTDILWPLSNEQIMTIMLGLHRYLNDGVTPEGLDSKAETVFKTIADDLARNIA